MTERAIKNSPSLYDSDFFGWTEDQAKAIAERRIPNVDWANVAEEIESLGRSEKIELASRLNVLIAHLLKWHFQPERRSASWQTTIGEQRTHIEGVIDASPSLASYPGLVLDRAYERGRRKAASEMRIAVTVLPETPPYSIDQILDYGFMPGEDWNPDDLSDD